MKWRWPTVWSEEQGGWWRFPTTLVLLMASARLGAILCFAVVPTGGAFNHHNPATMKEVVRVFADPLPKLLALAGLLAGIRFVHHKPVGCIVTDGRAFKVRLAIESAVVFALLWFVGVLVQPQGGEYLARRACQVSPDWWPILALSVFGASLVDISPEEALFRGYLQPRLGAWVKSPWVAVGISAALFTLIHRGCSWAAYSCLALAGVLWGAAAIRAGTLAPLLGSHAMNNTLNYLWFPNETNAGTTWVSAMIWAAELVIWFGWLLWATRRGPVEALAQPDGTAKRSQPVGSGTNRTSAAAGPGG